MGKVVVTEFFALDGVIGEPQEWSFPYWGDDIAAFKTEELLATGAHLLGRVTYEGFAAAWPERASEEGGFAYLMNTLPKYVVSTTLQKAEWNNSHIISGNLSEAVTQLKQEIDGDLLVAGSATLVNSLIEKNLVDEYRLLVYPIVLGTGKRLFKEDVPANLKLTETKPMASGVVLLRYEPDRK